MQTSRNQDRADWRFMLKEWLRQPLGVSSVKPSSAALARFMAAQIPSSASRVLELGPGTGPMTQAILRRGIASENLFLVEKNPNFAALMQARFPSVHCITGDATELDRILPPPIVGEIDAVISGLPLLSMRRETRRAIVQQSFAVMRPGGVFVQFTYGLIPPFDPKHLQLSAQLAGRVWENFPPAGVWVYRASNADFIAA
jgi:phosphatidylethanolamine/phosphatidyl-N-methylethanolamine N-methyltransferase